MISSTKFAQKIYFGLKTEKTSITIELYILKFVYVTNFTLNKKCWILGPNFPKSEMSNFCQKGKTEDHHWILHIWINLGTKF